MASNHKVMRWTEDEQACSYLLRRAAYAAPHEAKTEEERRRYNRSQHTTRRSYTRTDR
jgi:hypothetical protein